MEILSRIRRLTFLVILVAALMPGGAVMAGDEDPCPAVGDCDSCDTAPGECLNEPGESCTQWAECTFQRTCSYGGSNNWRICECGPCPQ